MKKITFTILCSLLISTVFAQGFEFKKSDNTPINNGDIVSYGDTGSYLNFRVKNTSSTPLDIKIKCISLVNATGTSFELCYGGQCFDSVVTNGIYPDYENFLTPGQSNPSQGDHFVNNFNGLTSGIVDYVFKVYAVGAESQSITFTYRFNPSLSVGTVNDLNSLGINLNSTILKSNINFTSTLSGTMNLVNMSGQQVGSYTFTSGTQSINVDQFNSGIYIANFQTTEGKTSQVKLIKK